MGKNHATGFATMLDAVTAYCHCLRAVAKEDRAQLESADLAFNLHTLVAGAQPEDDEPSIFLVYPEGHWIEVDRRTPYLAVGATAYGKPILHRALPVDTSMPTAPHLASPSSHPPRSPSPP